MPTGYEVQQYKDLARIAKATERIADSLARDRVDAELWRARGAAVEVMTLLAEAEVDAQAILEDARLWRENVAAAEAEQAEDHYERREVGPAALLDFAALSTLTWTSVGEALSCAEAETVATLLRACGEDAKAEALIESHAEIDEEGDAHYAPRRAAAGQQ